MNFCIVYKVYQFFFLAKCRLLIGLNSAVVYFLMSIVIVKMKSTISNFKAFCLSFNLNVFYLNLVAWFTIGISLEHTCSEAEEIENGHQQIR